MKNWIILLCAITQIWACTSEDADTPKVEEEKETEEVVEKETPKETADLVNFYIGAYTKTDDETDTSKKGISLASFDQKTGQITDKGVQVEATNPSFLAFHPSGNYLYSVAEGANDGSLNAYKIDQTTNGLTLLNSTNSGGKSPCHLSVSADGKYLFAANYAGNISVTKINDDGSLSNQTGVTTHEGKGITNRQKSSHPHMTFARGKQVFVTDLGTDVIVAYHVDEENVTLVADQTIKIPAGSGPRHIAMTKDSKSIYLVNELNSTVCLIQKNAAQEWEVVNTYPTLKDTSLSGACADIHLSSDESFLYLSNRGKVNSISVFAVDNTSGTLTAVQEQSVLGESPRNFSLSPNGKYMLVANQNTSDIVVFTIDATTGLLSSNNTKLATNKPVCIKFIQ